MAEDKLTNIANALSQKFAPELARQYNRVGVGLSHIESEATNNGKNVAWDVELGAATAAAYLEGADIGDSDYSVDKLVPATQAWAEYRSAFFISGTQVDAAAMSSGSALPLLDIVKERVLSAGTIVTSLMNKDFYAGTGTDGSGTPNIVGLDAATQPTGLYAGLQPSDGAEWAGVLLSNGGVARPLTTDLIKTGDQQLFINRNEMPDKYLCSPGVYRKYSELFEPLRRFQGSEVSVYNTGSDQLFFRGVPIFQDKDIVETGGKGKLYGIISKYVKKVYLPRAGLVQDFGSYVEEGKGFNGVEDYTKTQLPFKVIYLAKTGNSYKFMVHCIWQLKVTHRNSIFAITDIAV